MRNPSPTIVVGHHGRFGPVLDRAHALRSAHGSTLIGLDTAEFDPDELHGLLGQFDPETVVLIGHLVGDLDIGSDGSDVPAGVVDCARELYQGLRREFPTLRADTWFILRSGRSVGSAELRLAALGAGIRDFPVGGVVAISSASGSSLSHEDDDVDRQVADVLHVLACSSLGSELTATNLTAWSVGIGSVVYRPERLVVAAASRVEPTLEGLVAVRSRDPGERLGRKFVEDQMLGPPMPGEDRRDVHADLLLTGPGSGSLADEASAQVRRLDGELEGVDPGLWADYISTAIDRLTALSGSPLASALDQLDRNLHDRAAELSEQLESELRSYVETQQNLPTADDWCKGARAALSETIEQLELPRDEPDIDLEGACLRLERAAKKLPYSSSTLVRGLFLTVLMLVLGYSYAPIGTFVAWAFSARVFWFGETLEENARTWARLTAVGSGTLVWLWWEMQWRRIRRFRRRYIQMAAEQVRRFVHDYLDLGRRRLLRDLEARIGDPSAAGSFHTWLAQATEAVDLVRTQAAGGSHREAALCEGEWAVAIPAEGEPSRVLGEMSPELSSRLAEIPVEVVARSPVEVQAEGLAHSILESLNELLPPSGVDLSAQWPASEAIGDDARAALGANLKPGLDEGLAARRGTDTRRYLVAAPSVAGLVEGLGESSRAIGDQLGSRSKPAAGGFAGFTFDSRITSEDGCFAANVWTTSLVITEEDSKKPTSSPEPERSGADDRGERQGGEAADGAREGDQ